MTHEIDYAVRLFLHKRFIPRAGVDRVGRCFSIDDMPPDDGRSSEAARTSKWLFLTRLIYKYANPCDDIYQAQDETGKIHAVRMQWLRLYWEPDPTTRNGN